MRTLVVGLVAAGLLIAGCSDSPDASPESPPGPSPTHSGTDAATEVAQDEPELLPMLWDAPLYASGRVYAVSRGHWLATGTVDNSPGTTNPTPNIQLDYGVGDAETGVVSVVEPLNLLPNTVEAIPGTDLFVAVGGDQVGVLDPSLGEFLWKRRTTIGTEVVDMSATRIWMGRTTQDGNPICFTADTGEIVRHDTACLDADIASNDVVEGVSLQANSVQVDLPDSDLVPDFDEFDIRIPVTRASDDETHEPLWSYGDVSVHHENDQVSYATSTFATADLGLIRVDYSHSLTPSQDGQESWPESVLRLVDARTGEVVRTLGRVAEGTLVGFAGDVAIFEQPDSAAGVGAIGYRMPG